MLNFRGLWAGCVFDWNFGNNGITHYWARDEKGKKYSCNFTFQYALP